MYLRLVSFKLTEGGRANARTMAQDLVSSIKGQPGCCSAMFFGGAADGESGICVAWETQEDADAAAAVISPKLEAYLAGNVESPPSRRLFPVLAS